MGYRSDVVIALSPIALTKKLMSDIDTSVLEEADQTFKNETAAYCLFEGWKWYEGYKDIDNITKFLHTLDQEEFGFMRIGEESADIEEWGSPDDFDIYTERYISSPFD